VSEDADYWRQQAHDVMAELHERESQLGEALATIARLEAEAGALRHALEGTTRMMAERSNNNSRAFQWMRDIVVANQQALGKRKESSDVA
jgi:hypothetical protein